MDLLAPIQQSFEGFLQWYAGPDERAETGLERVLRETFPIASQDGEVRLEFCGYSLDRPKFDAPACIERGMTFAAPLKVVLRLVRVAGAAAENPHEIIDIREQEIYLGELPLSTNRGTVIVNGEERFFPLETRRAPGLRAARGAGPALFALDDLGNALIFEMEGGDLRVRFELDEAIPPALFWGERAAVGSLRMTERGEFCLASAHEGGAANRGRDERRKAPRLAERALTEREIKRLLFARDAGAAKGKRPLVKRGDKVTIKRLQKLASEGVREVAVVTFEPNEAPAPLITRSGEEVAAWFEEHVGSFWIPALIDPRLDGVLDIRGWSRMLTLGPDEVAALARAMLSGEIARRAPEELPWPVALWGPGEILTQASFVGMRATVAEVQRLLAAAGSHVEWLMPHDVVSGRPLSIAVRVCLDERTKQLPARTPLLALESLRAVTHRGGLVASAGGSQEPESTRLPLSAAIDDTEHVLSMNEGDTPLAEALVPFGAMFPDEARRGAAAMLAALPLEKPEAPVLKAGLESEVARRSGSLILAWREGEVTYVDEEAVLVAPDGPTLPRPDWYELEPAEASFDGGRTGHHPTVSVGQRIEARDVVAEGEATAGGGLALGRNMRVVFQSSASGATISDRALNEGCFTSLHAFWLECVEKDTRAGKEELTSTPPKAPGHAGQHLDACGIVEEGVFVEPGDWLVGKRTPDFDGSFKDTSLRVPADRRGVVKRVRMFARYSMSELARYKAQRERARTRIARRQEAEDAAVTASAKAIAERVLVEAGDDRRDLAKKTLEVLFERRPSAAVAEPLDALRQAVDKARDALMDDHRERACYVERSDDLPPGVIALTKVLLEERRPLQIGDVLADRNGLRARVEAIADADSMPMLPDGSRADVILPLSSATLPSLLEAHLAARSLSSHALGVSPESLPARLAEAERAQAGVLYLFKLA